MSYGRGISKNRGLDNPMCVLTPAQVQVIEKQANVKRPGKIADELGLTYHVVYRAIQRMRGIHVKSNKRKGFCKCGRRSTYLLYGKGEVCIDHFL